MEHNSNYGTRWRSTMEIIARQQRRTSVVALQICSLVAVANHCQQYYRGPQRFLVATGEEATNRWTRQSARSQLPLAQYY